MSAEKQTEGLPARFKQALQHAEKSRDPKPVAGLFADGAQLTNLGGDHGNDATVFWQTYLDQFEEIRSEFTHDTVGENSASMEWQSRGTTAEGKPVDYRGISVIDFDGDRITGFRTYYDSAAFVRNGR
ncbi:MAG: nuclear transport factor 2 family protein [Verrucomicrobiota bacterium]|nr:nuclear transport factor 2 family protein [Verrucomicrobiota bacterium]